MQIVCNFRHPAWLIADNQHKNMNTTAHTLISASLAALLGLFTTLSALFAGLASTATITGISLFVALGMIEIMIQSYARPTRSVHRVRVSPSRVPHAAEVVPFSAASERRAA